MATKKFKLTGFARFLFVMLLLAPLAYIGASYANGEDGIENFKNLFKGEVSMGTNTIEDASSTDETTKVIETPVQQNNDLDQGNTNKEIKILRAKNSDLQEQLEAKTKELEEVKAQLKAVQDAIRN